MKKYLVIIVIALMVVVSTAYTQTCDCDSLQAQIDELTARIAALEGSATSAEAAEETATTGDFEPVVIGDYTLELIDWKIDTRKYSDEKYIEIHYRYTNNSSESKSFGWSIGRKAYQDGIGLNSTIITDSETVTDIRPGKSIEVRDGFKIRSEETEIELEFTPFMAYKAEPITRFIAIK